MNVVLILLMLAFLAYRVAVRRVVNVRRVIASFLLLGAISAFTAGLSAAVREDALGRYGRVVAGTIGERFSSTGEQATRTIGRNAGDYIRTGNDNQFYDQLARLVATGSTDMWAVSYSFPCGSATPCWDRSVMPHQRWLQTRKGQPIEVRYVKPGFGGSRLEEQPLWPVAIARMAIGVVLAAAAALAWGEPWARRVRHLATLAVVTEVEPVHYRGGPRWRVRFSYVDKDGNAHEASDEFATPGWKPGDTGVAMYESANPKAAGLQRA